MLLFDNQPYKQMLYEYVDLLWLKNIRSEEFLVRGINVSALNLCLTFDPAVATQDGETQTTKMEDFLYTVYSYTMVWKVVKMVSQNTACPFKGKNRGNVSFSI